MGINDVKKLVAEQIKECENLKRKKDLTEDGKGHLLIAKAVSETLGTEKGRGCLAMIDLIARELNKGTKNWTDWVKEYKTLYP